MGPFSREVELSKRVRLAIVVAAGLLIFGVPGMLVTIGGREANHKIVMIRAAAPNLHVERSTVLASVVYSKEDPANSLAAALGVPETDVTLTLGPADWCAKIHIRRLLGQRQMFLTWASDGSLHPVKSCGRG